MLIAATLAGMVLSGCTPAHQPMDANDVLGCAYHYTDCGTDAAPLSGPMEDEPGWDCRTDGNRICGPEYEADTGEYIGGYN